jgi:cytochrome bd-type quinol oxidase subunit 1
VSSVAVMLSRLQFAFTIGFHILWPAYTIGVCGFYLWRRQHLEFAGAGFSAA